MSNGKILISLLLVLFSIGSSLGQTLGNGVLKIDRTEKEKIHTINVISIENDTVVFNYLWMFPSQIIDSYIDDKFCLIVFMSNDSVFYSFSAAYKIENIWYIDYIHGWVFHIGEYFGISGNKVSVYDVEIIDGETMMIKYLRTNLPTGREKQKEIQLGQLFTLTQYGLFHKKGKFPIFGALPKYPNSPREIVRIE